MQKCGHILQVVCSVDHTASCLALHDASYLQCQGSLTLTGFEVKFKKVRSTSVMMKMIFIMWLLSKESYNRTFLLCLLWGWIPWISENHWLAQVPCLHTHGLTFNFLKNTLFVFQVSVPILVWLSRLCIWLWFEGRMNLTSWKSSWARTRYSSL